VLQAMVAPHDRVVTRPRRHTPAYSPPRECAPGESLAQTNARRASPRSGDRVDEPARPDVHADSVRVRARAALGPRHRKGGALLKPARTTSVTRRLGGARLPLSCTLRTLMVACGRPPGFLVVRVASHVGVDESPHAPAGRDE
jgi:hypothetical protein